MHDSVQRVFRRLLGHRRLAEGQHVELAVEYFRVKAHCVSAVTVEGQIRNDLWHDRFSCAVSRANPILRGLYSRRTADAQSDSPSNNFMPHRVTPWVELQNVPSRVQASPI